MSPARLGGPRASVLAATCLITMAGGAMDAWVYLSHGHVFANAQTGNVVLMGVAIAQGDRAGVVEHLSPLAAFIAGLLLSRLAGPALKRAKLISRVIRLGVECLLLLALAFLADRLPDRTVAACVGFIAGVQITSLSHIGSWSFNTGMTTGNLRGAVTALSRVLTGTTEEWPHVMVLTALCTTFTVGAVAGAWLVTRLGSLTLVPVAALVAVATLLTAGQRDPIPEWKSLE